MFHSRFVSLILVVCFASGGLSLAGEKRLEFVVMRDGTRMRTCYQLPDGKGPWPVVFRKTYGESLNAAKVFNEARYAYVAQRSRVEKDPHHLSGNTRLFADDVDGYDTIEWIAKQPWCDGTVAMHGSSYAGATQWLAAGNSDPGPPPALKAIIPSAFNPDPWDRCYRAQGAINLSMATMSRAFSNRKQATFKNYMHLPLIEMDQAVSGRKNTLWNEYVSHGKYDKYWDHIGMRNKYKKIKIPVYLHAGWWDYYSGGALKYYNLLRAEGHTPEIRVLIDNGGHSGMHHTRVIRWLDWVVRGKRNGIEKEPPVQIFLQGINKDRQFHQWPPRGTSFVNYYLHSPEGERTGTLNTTKPGEEKPTPYNYDPRDPVPSIGGNANHRGVNATLSSGAVLREGSHDQRPVENRPDVLVFSTSPLAEDVQVIGPVSLKLYAASSARDTDFTAVLIDVGPDGMARNVTEGIVRARFRESIWMEPKLITPGKIYEYNLKLLPTARVFRRGHQIRLHLSSSRFPLWDRNTNTGNNPATDTETKVAHQTVHHDATYPTHLVLPVLPLSENPK